MPILRPKPLASDCISTRLQRLIATWYSRRFGAVSICRNRLLITPFDMAKVGFRRQILPVALPQARATERERLRFALSRPLECFAGGHRLYRCRPG